MEISGGSQKRKVETTLLIISNGCMIIKTYYIIIFNQYKGRKEGRKCFYLTTHSTHFIYGYMASDIW